MNKGDLLKSNIEFLQGMLKWLKAQKRKAITEDQKEFCRIHIETITPMLKAQVSEYESLN